MVAVMATLVVAVRGKLAVVDTSSVEEGAWAVLGKRWAVAA
jgi:hypothetical protein